MEYHREAKFIERPRIPIGVRSFIYRLSKTGALEGIGSSYYRWAALKIARAFYHFHDVHSIYLIGGGLTRCVPGISDLDFIVVVEPAYEEAFLRQFRQILKRQRRLYPVLGEVHVMRPDAWTKFKNSQNAYSEWFIGRHRFLEDEWKPEKVSFKATPSLETRLALSLLHYWKAHGYLVRSKEEYPEYFQSHFQREISKAIDFSIGTSLKIRRDLPFEALIQNAIQRIEKSAVAILSSQTETPPLVLKIKEKGGERFALEIQQRRWFDALRNASVVGDSIEMTPVPGVMLFNRGNESLIKKFYSALSGFSSPPLLLGPKGVELVRRGLGWGAPGDHLNWFSPADREDFLFLRSVSQLSYLSIRERFSLNVALFRGKIVSVPMEKLHRLFEEVFFCYWCLKNGCLTNDESVLANEIKMQFPNLPSRKKDDYLQALKEMETFEMSFPGPKHLD